MEYLISYAIAAFLFVCVLRYVLDVPSVYKKFKHNRKSGFSFVDSIVIAWRWVH